MKTTYVTAEGKKKLVDELEHLKKVRRPQIANRIKEAKELGDLSENAEYADARDEQSFSEGRILELEEMLKDIEVIQDKSSDPNVVEIGDTIIVEKNGESRELTIVGSNEADPLAGKISNESPLGKAFLGKNKGQEAVCSTPKVGAIYKILEIKS